MALFPSIVACSGPGAGQAIADSIAYANGQAIVALILTIATAGLWLVFRRQALVWAFLASLVFLCIHPAWTVSAIHGDCGQFKVMAATFVSFVTGILLGVQVIVGAFTYIKNAREQFTAPEGFAENLPATSLVADENPYAPPQ